MILQQAQEALRVLNCMKYKMWITILNLTYSLSWRFKKIRKDLTYTFNFNRKKINKNGIEHCTAAILAVKWKLSKNSFCLNIHNKTLKRNNSNKQKSKLVFHMILNLKKNQLIIYLTKVKQWVSHRKKIYYNKRVRVIRCLYPRVKI